MTKHFLSARTVAAALRRGSPRRHGDGGGLYLKVAALATALGCSCQGGRQATAYWPWPVRAVSLKAARELAEACRTAVQGGPGPKHGAGQAGGEMTFDSAARALIESMAPSWRNPSTARNGA